MRFNDTFILHTYVYMWQVKLIFRNSHHHYFMTFMRLRAVRKWNVGITIALSTIERWTWDFSFLYRKKRRRRRRIRREEIQLWHHFKCNAHGEHEACDTEYWILKRKIDKISEKRKKEEKPKQQRQTNKKTKTRTVYKLK